MRSCQIKTGKTRPQMIWAFDLRYNNTDDSLLAPDCDGKWLHCNKSSHVLGALIFGLKKFVWKTDETSCETRSALAGLVQTLL